MTLVGMSLQGNQPSLMLFSILLLTNVPGFLLWQRGVLSTKTSTELAEASNLSKIQGIMYKSSASTKNAFSILIASTNDFQLEQGCFMWSEDLLV
jgi:hypothetical protein